MLISRIFLLCALLGLGACASSPRYVAADDAGDYGHYSRKISENRYRVNFNGSRRTNLQDTRDYALLRAAELTLAEGFEWFQVVDRESATIQARESRASIGYGAGYANRYEHAYYVQQDCGLVSCSRRTYPARQSYWRVDTGHPAETHSHSLEIVMGKGEMPQDGHYYDARAVVNAIYDSI